MTDKEKLDLLVKYITESIPYVEATISTGNSFKSETRPGWIEIHEGRAMSSRIQLERILKLAQS